MTKKLPQVFQVPINNKLKNNKEVYYSNYSEDTSSNQSDVKLIVEQLFKTTGYVFRTKLKIITNNNTYETSIMAKTNKGIVTINNIFIPYEEIKQIITK